VAGNEAFSDGCDNGRRGEDEAESGRFVQDTWGRDPGSALYLGDNIDDALAAREAGVPFVAIIAQGEHNYRARAKRFRELGALALLPRAMELNHWLALRD